MNKLTFKQQVKVQPEVKNIEQHQNQVHTGRVCLFFAFFLPKVGNRRFLSDYFLHKYK